MTEPLATALGDLRAAAVAQGKVWRLDCADGTWMCAGCGVECPFDVSLHCEFCLAEHRAKRVQRLLREAQRSPEDRRWEGMAWAIAKDSRLDQEGAQRILQKAQELPSYTQERMTALRLAYERRWEPRDAGATYAAATAAVDPAEVWDRD